MKNPFKDFLNFSKGDRRAIFALGCIATFCIGILIITNAINSSKRDQTTNFETIDSLLAEQEKLEKENVNNNTNSLSQTYEKQSFDPNTVDSITLIHHGLKPYQVRNFLHYRKAGKVFRTAEDLGNTYGWTKEDVEMLKPYIRISHNDTYDRLSHNNSTNDINASNNSSNHNAVNEGAHNYNDNNKASDNTKNYPNKFKKLTVLDINKVDSATLRQVPGIGEKICEAILRYRTKLGGFHSKEQLLEISIFSPELLEWFKTENSPELKRININKASFQALNSHPYITYDQTRDLLKYIRLYGKINDEKTLMSTKIFTQEEIEKLRPYIEY